MDANASAGFGGRMLAGASGSLGALLGARVTPKAKAPQRASTAQISGWCVSHPVWFVARVRGGGAAAVLMSQADAASLVARVSGEDPATRVMVSAADSAALQELSDAIAGGGVAALGGAIAAEKVEYRIGGDAAALTAAMGNDAIAVEVQFSDETGATAALLLYSGELERRAAGAAPDTEEPLVSKEEVRDILQDFTPEADADHAPRRNGGPLPDNLDVVMDIELVATARLGKVEVPVSEILNYGPGSIIELGHVVDEPIELLVNGKLIARGDVVVVDERFGLRITEIVSPRERIESLR